MSDDTISRTYVTSSSGDGSSSEQIHRDVELLVVKDDELHVWFRGTHYIGIGTASTIDEGDMFVDLNPERTIFRIKGTSEKPHPSDRESGTRRVADVDIYSAASASSKMSGDEILVDALIDELDNVSMGYAGPPVALTEAEAINES